jgi:hypothetical protein
MAAYVQAMLAALAIAVVLLALLLRKYRHLLPHACVRLTVWPQGADAALASCIKARLLARDACGVCTTDLTA